MTTQLQKATNPTNSKSDPQPLGKTEKLLKEIRQTPIFRQLIPQEAAIGWPIPLRKEGKVYVTLPFYGYSPQKSQSPLFPPFASLTLLWANQVPVEYINLRFRNPDPNLKWEGQIGTFPHPAVQQMTRGQYKEKRRELLLMYDEMFEMLSQNSAFSTEWCRRFSEHLRLLIEPSLEPYYRVLGEKFFERFLPRTSIN